MAEFFEKELEGISGKATKVYIKIQDVEKQASSRDKERFSGAWDRFTSEKEKKSKKKKNKK